MGARGPKKGSASFGGRPLGAQNKVTGAVKDMILRALEEAGGVEYLKEQAKKNPKAFMSLVGRVLPYQVTGENGGAIICQLTPQDLNA